jgi:4'-phosphopantetheinyl transferase
MSRPAPLRVPPLGSAACQVWWARLADHRPNHPRLLDPVETERRAAFRIQDDQDRFTLGVVVTRTILAANLGVTPEQVKLNRDCPDCGRPHGRPQLVSGGGGIAFSVSHSGDLVGVAFGIASGIGLDVERVAPPRADGLADAVLSPAERAEFDRSDPARRGHDFFRYWVRKEAVLKATGEGLRVPLPNLTISPADQAPRLVQWSGRPDAAARFALYDLDCDPGHAASLAIIGERPQVREYDAAGLIGRSGQV